MPGPHLPTARTDCAGTPVPLLAALLDSQRDSTSPKGPGSGQQPGSAGGGTGQRPDMAQAAGAGVCAAGAGLVPMLAADPDNGGKQCGSGGSDAALPVNAFAAPAPAAAAQQEQPWQGGSQQAQQGAERKRPASQEADPRWHQKRSRFGRESQEQQEQQQQQEQLRQQPQLEGRQPQQGEPHQQQQQPQGASGAGSGSLAGAAGRAAGRAERAGSQPPLTQGDEPEQQGGQQALDGSEPCSSSGIICTQQPPSSGTAGGPLPQLSTLPGPPHGGLAAAAAPPLAALHHLWQQQGVASPLLALLGTPGGLAAQPGQGWEDAAAAGAGGAASPWQLGPAWQPAPVAGAAEGATPRFVGPTAGGSSGATPWQLGAAVLAPLAGAPAQERNPLRALLGFPGYEAAADVAAQLSQPGAVQQAQRHQLEAQQAQHHRLARSSSPQGPAVAAAAAAPTLAWEGQLPGSNES